MFGSIFKYKDEEYVYIADDVENDIIYAAKILDDDNTKLLQRLEVLKQKSGVPLHNNPAFSYILLSTDEFKKRAVICGVTEGVNLIKTPHGVLNDEDKLAIKKEIQDGPAPHRVKFLLNLLS